MRKIYGSVIENEECRISRNNDLQQLYKSDHNGKNMSVRPTTKNDTKKNAKRGKEQKQLVPEVGGSEAENRQRTTESTTKDVNYLKGRDNFFCKHEETNYQSIEALVLLSARANYDQFEAQFLLYENVRRKLF